VPGGGGGGGGSNVIAGTAGQIAYYSDSVTVKGNGVFTFDETVSNVDLTGNLITIGQITAGSVANVESNILTLESRGLQEVTEQGNTTTEIVQFSNGFVVGSNLTANEFASNVLDIIGNVYVANNITLGSNINIRSTQTNAVINIGRGTGETNQDSDCITIGDSAGNSNQGLRAIAFGNDSGKFDQGNYALAFGNAAGNNLQGARAVAIGTSAGVYNQNFSAVAIGRQAGLSNQGSHCIAIGTDTGLESQGIYSIAIGYDSNALASSIVLNATGSALYPTTTDGFFVKPIKTDTSKKSNVITYDLATGELFDSGGLTLSNVVDNGNTTSSTVQFTNTGTSLVTSGSVGVGTTSPSANLHVVGNVHATGAITSDGAIYGCFGGTTGFSQALTGTATVLNFGTSFENSSTDHFTLASGVVTVVIAGVYSISYNVSTTIISGTDRSDSEAYIGINGTEFTNSRTYMYNRTNGVGENTGSASFVKTLSANDTVAIYILQTAGTSSISANKGRAQISLYRLN